MKTAKLNLMYIFTNIIIVFIVCWSIRYKFIYLINFLI